MKKGHPPDRPRVRPNDDVNPTSFVIDCSCGTSYTVAVHKLVGSRCPNCSTSGVPDPRSRQPRRVRRQRRR